MGAENDAHAPAKQENISALQKRVNFLAGKVEAMLAEHEYEKTQQVQFQEASESVLNVMTYLNIGMTIITAGVMGLSTTHLKSHFRQKKLI